LYAANTPKNCSTEKGTATFTLLGNRAVTFITIGGVPFDFAQTEPALHAAP
jgi:hypothetical protein